MKKIAIVVAVLAAVLLFSTCSKPTISIDECISNFMSDINSSDRSNVYTNLDSSSAMYNLVKTHSYWDTEFDPIGIPYSLSGNSTVGSVVSATVNTTNATWNTHTIQFVMNEDSDKNAVIHSIAMDSSTTIYN
jgi:PBP1b-binding outer membrane lipoprotein LpoB